MLSFTQAYTVHLVEAAAIQTVLTQFPRAQIKTDDREPLRQFPDKHAATLALLTDGTPLQVMARDDEGRWVYVRVEGGVQEGWVAVASIINLDDLSGLPIQTISAEDILNNLDYWNFTPAMQRVFALGQSLGNRPDYFSKVGDSITVSRAYLYPFSYHVYNLTERYLYLQTALDFFNISEEHSKTAFREPSRAARGGWTTDNVLAEDYYYLCKAGDTRLSCEYRINQPASALIMIGTNDAVIMDPAHYAKNLRRIIETSFAMGVIPVISTIPAQPRNEVRVGRFNLIIVEVAQEYNIPLWNYWHAMEQLPNRGLSFDGVHPSAPPNEAGTTLFTDENLQYGYTLRNLMALHVLDLLLFDVMYAA
jgi:hypothetical protein